MNSVRSVKQACDLDLYVDMLARDEAHLARAKAKAARYRRARRAAARPKKSHTETAACAVLAGVGLWTLVLACLV